MAKRTKPGTDSAQAIFGMTPWTNEFADWRAQQAVLDQQEPAKAEEVNSLEETKGCAIMDSGATVMCSSTAAAEEIQMQRLRRSEPGDPSVRGSDRCFRFADGRTDEAQNMVEQPITAGLLKGKSINMHLISRSGSEASPLFSADDQRRHRMVVDYEENKVMFKDRPEEWHTLPTTKKGLMMIPLTKEASARHMTSTTSPHPEPILNSTEVKKRHRKHKACNSFVCQDCRPKQ